MPKTTWGRKETIIWPQNRPIYTYAAIISALILTAVFVFGWVRLFTKPLQWFYAPVYVRTSIFGTFSRTHRSEYRMLFLTGHGL
ncbi:MAG: ArsR family transcriptional regulator, partial [Terriglobus sp.]